jgi:predicted Zn-dependent peptidase
VEAVNSLDRHGNFSISTALHRDHLAHALEIIKEGIGWLTNGGFTDDDVAHEKAYLIASMPRSFQRVSSMINSHSFMALTRFEEEYDEFQDINQRLAVTNDDVVHAAREHLTPECMVAVFRGDTPERVHFAL